MKCFLRSHFFIYSSHFRHRKDASNAPLSTLSHYFGSIWIAVNSHNPKAVIDHSISLKADFDNVYNTLEASLSKASRFSSNPQNKVAQSIRNAIVEAQANGYCSKWSAADKDNFVGIILDNIATEASASSGDSIPLAQFYTLHASYQELYAKLKAQSQDASMHSRLDSAGKETIPNVALSHDHIVEIKSYSTTVILSIEHQLSVNRMEEKESHLLGEAIADSLQAFFYNDWFRGSVRLSSANLLDTGDVEIVARADHREDLERILQTTAWHADFERTLGPLPTETLWIRMHNMRIGCMVFTTRKEKSAVIRSLVDTNFPTDSDNSSCSFIKDIYWCARNKRKEDQGTTALYVEFRFPDQANKALADGLYWEGQRHTCNIKSPNRFCHNRQTEGHLTRICSAEPRCRNCAGQHRTAKCTSTKRECVSCGGPHPSYDRGCLDRMQAQFF